MSGFFRRLLLGLFVLSSPVFAQTTPVLQAYAAMPVRGSIGGPLGPRLSFDQFEVLEMHRSFSILQGGLEVPLPGIMATYHSQSKQKLRFVLENRQARQQAQVFALADLQLRGDVLDNLNGVLHGGRGRGIDSATWKNRNVDIYMGVISLVGRPTEANWQFAVENSSQIGLRPLHGIVKSKTQQISFSEVTDALAYADGGGGMAGALLAAQVQRGFVFSYQGRPIAALDLGDLRRRSRQVFYLRKNLDPTLQLVVASMATALLARPMLK